MDNQQKEFANALEIVLLLVEDAAKQYREKLFTGNAGDLSRAQIRLQRELAQLAWYEKRLSEIKPKPLTQEQVTSADSDQIEYWLNLVEAATDSYPDDNGELNAAWLSQRDEALSLGLLQWEIDLDGYYLSPTDIWLQLSDKFDVIELANAAKIPVVIHIQANNDPDYCPYCGYHHNLHVRHTETLEWLCPEHDEEACEGCGRLTPECVCD